MSKRSNDSIERSQRKVEHVLHAMAVSAGTSNGLEDVKIVHQAFPEIDAADVMIKTRFNQKRLSAPILINAMTGGHPNVFWINQELARIAQQTGIAIAVGSQVAALEDSALRSTFTIVRELNPTGVVFSNVPAYLSPDQVLQAVEMIAADGVQLHLNPTHELVMLEGRRTFHGILENVSKIRSCLRLPIIMKEVGFGLSREAVELAFAAGVDWFDVGGAGGTDFFAIEQKRNKLPITSNFSEWGIPTASSLLEVLGSNLPIKVIATGGIKSPLEAAKCLALGAELVGIAGNLLKLLILDSSERVIAEIEQMKRELHMILTLCGAENIAGLRQVPLVISGRTYEWARERGIRTEQFARRKRH